MTFIKLTIARGVNMGKPIYVNIERIGYLHRVLKDDATSIGMAEISDEEAKTIEVVEKPEEIFGMTTRRLV